MADAVDAIIVVGPVLWKCVNCNLLVSRQHSVDQHLRACHRSKINSEHFQHTKSPNKKCSVAGCSCRTMPKRTLVLSKKKHTACNDSEDTVNSLHSRKNVNPLNYSGEEDAVNSTSKRDDNEEEDGDNYEDDDEVPQELRDLVERASKVKEKELEATSDPDLSPERFENAIEVELCFSATGDAGVKSVEENGKCFNKGDTIHNKTLENSVSKPESRYLKRKLSDTKKNENTNKTLDSEELNNLSTATSAATNWGQGRRTSGRANKGKNPLYSEYKLEMG